MYFTALSYFQKNLDVALGDEEEITIVSIQPSTFLNSLREETATGTKKRDSNGNGEISGVSGRRRPRRRGEWENGPVETTTAVQRRPPYGQSENG